MAAGTSVLVLGDRDTFGGHFYGPADHTGPVSYPTGGELVDAVALGCYNGVQTLIASADQTGTYIAIPIPLNDGHTQWKLKWTTLAGAEVGSGTNLSGYTVRLSAIGS